MMNRTDAASPRALLPWQGYEALAMNLRHLKTLGCACLAALLPGCVGQTGVSGVVVDQDTHKPIEGAYVQVYWTGAGGGLVDSGAARCLHTAVARSDENGKFSVPAWRHFSPLNVFLDKDSIYPTLMLYRAGYVVTKALPASDGQYVVGSNKLTGQQRAEELEQAYRSCFDDWNSDADSILYLEAVLKEAREIPLAQRSIQRGGTIDEAIRRQICSIKLIKHQFQQGYWSEVDSCTKQE